MLLCTEVLLIDLGIEKSREQIWSNDGYFKWESSGATLSKVNNYQKITFSVP